MGGREAVGRGETRAGEEGVHVLEWFVHDHAVLVLEGARGEGAGGEGVTHRWEGGVGGWRGAEPRGTGSMW